MVLDPSGDVLVGTMTVTLYTVPQGLKHFNLGILDGRSITEPEVIAAVADWVVQDRVAMLIGYFPKDKALVEELAHATGATWESPLYQELRVWTDHGRIRGTHELMAPPTYMMTFGLYRRVKRPTRAQKLPFRMQMGDDLMLEMLHFEDLPSWKRNDKGSVFVPNHGSIIMKPADFNWWISHVYQTCVWLGSSLPSQSWREKRDKRKKKLQSTQSAEQLQSTQWKRKSSQGSGSQSIGTRPQSWKNSRNHSR